MADDFPATTPTTRRILCIEDERFISELYVRAFTQAGYQIDVRPDGQEGLETAEKNIYDIILLDLMIPNLPGIDILHKLKDPARTPPLKAKVIITTNLEQREQIRSDIEKQADGYIVKAEMTPHELVTFVNTIN